MQLSINDEGGVCMVYTNELFRLKRVLMSEYLSYKGGDITEQEYLIRAKPIDLAIDKLEMATLRDTLALRGSFLPHTPKLEY